jgi:two-component system LytT family sensor kinase
MISTNAGIFYTNSRKISVKILQHKSPFCSHYSVNFGMKLKRAVVYHIAAWLLVSTFFIIPLYVFGFTSKVQYAIICYLIYIFIFYINVLWILPWWVKNRNLWGLLFCWPSLIIVGTICGVLLNHVFNVFTRRGNLRLEVINTFLLNCLFVGVVLFAGVTYKSIADWFKNEQIRSKLENENLRTELDFLKSQVNPHFLFNTLNNIYALAYQNSSKTADAIMKLSEIMHYILYGSQTERVLVSQEIHYIKLLIALQELRVNGPLMLEFSVSGNTGSHSIAPLLLISFVENIFKHAVLNDRNDPAVISICVSDTAIQLGTRNKIDHISQDLTGGIGLANVRRRIALLYPGKHNFEIENDDLHYSVNLTIQLI